MNHHIDRCSVQAIWDSVTDFYHPDEIKSAKTLLWGIYGDILPDTHDRRDPIARGAHEKETSEMIDAMSKISALDEEEQFIYVASNLNRLPNHNPEEINIASVLQRLIDIEKRTVTIVKVVEKNTENITTIFDMNFQTDTYAAATRGISENSQRPLTPPLRNSSPLAASNSSQLGAMPDGQMAGTSHRPEANNGDRIIISEAGPPIQHTNGGARMVPDPVQTAVKERTQSKQAPRPRRERDRRTVYGTRQHETLKGASNNVNLFVFRVSQETTSENIETFLAEEGIQNAKVQCVSHQDAKSRSFKINVKINDKDKLMSSDFWPDGIVCRPFYEKRAAAADNSRSRRSSESENNP